MSEVCAESSRSGVSVIIPVHNAALTLEATLDSVVLQTYADWEAIIVDDGSNDCTGAVAEKWVQRDLRFHTLYQKKSGVSAARNLGLNEARYPYVLFLDGDARIAPRHLECMTGKLMANPSLGAVHCGFQFILPSGAASRSHLGPPEEDLFEHFAAQCPFPIHACVLRRKLALAVGGFDSELVTAEDWDFFQRVARTGARFGRVSEVLSFYHLRPGSAMRDNLRCLTDSLAVIERGHGRDPRIRIAAPDHMGGRMPALRDLALYYQITAYAAKEIGAGRDAQHFLEVCDLGAAPSLSADVVAGLIEGFLPRGAYGTEEEWFVLWGQVSVHLNEFLAKLEARTRMPALARTVLQQLEKKAIVTKPGNASFLSGNTYRTDVDVAKPVPDVPLPAAADRLVCRLMVHGHVVGVIELPGSGVVPGLRIAKAAAERNARQLVRKALTPWRFVSLCLRTLRGLMRRRTLRLLYDILVPKPNDARSAGLALKQQVTNVVKANLPLVLASRPGLAARRTERQWQEQLKAAVDAGRAFVREKIGPHENHSNWDRFFAVPDPFGYDSEYESVKYAQTLEFLAEGVITDALEIGCAEGHFTARLAPRVGRLTAVDVSRRALARAEARCASFTNVAFQNLDLNTDDIPGPFDLIVCSEVLYYIRDLPGAVSRILSQIRPGGFFLTCHARLLVDDPEGIGFDWNCAFGVETIANAIAAQAGVTLRRELRTPLYRILLYQRLAPGQQPVPTETMESRSVGRMTPVAAELARCPGFPSGKLAASRTRSVPILVYHRIAADGPPGLERYRVHPDLFAAQMTALHQAGYRTICLGEWASAMARLDPPRGKRVVLTFDDGYRDFLTGAVPVLRTHGFSATVFLVAERIGETAIWDSTFGESAALLSWEEIRALQEIGMEFGCHSSTHRPMTAMRLAELMDDTVRARAILEEGLAAQVTTLAYPYGAENEFVRRVVGDLGFSAAVTCGSGVSRLTDDPLWLPRIEVVSNCTPKQLLSLLEPPLDPDKKAIKGEEKIKVEHPEITFNFKL
jgi:peptidoglycan/xylan/chitin deacetylase (PgdA/CDA1 family)/SAM-dependent methyltransferase